MFGKNTYLADNGHGYTRAVHWLDLTASYGLGGDLGQLTDLVSY